MLIYLPGLIDIHVHLRDPGQIQKEDFYTGTCAALAGGFTTVLDMPNNKVPITTLEKLQKKIKTAQEKIVCNIGFYFSSLGDNFNEFKKINLPAGGLVFGLKLYLNLTTGHFLIDEKQLKKIYKSWPSNLPILVHCEEETISKVIAVVKKTGRKTHFCHISSLSELKQIIKAKEQGLPLTCGVSPHYLFLTENDVRYLGSFGLIKPPLKTKKDQDFLWKSIKYIDVIESDHAPHTIEEKKSAHPPYGVPGLETTLPLLLTAKNEGRISIDDIIRLCFVNPAKVFKIKTDKNTKIEIDEKKTFTVENKNLKTKCKWSPFAGWKMIGKVKRVFIRAEKVFEDDKILVKPGFGKVIYP